MRSKVKKVLSIVLTVCMLASMISTSVFASEFAFTSGDSAVYTGELSAEFEFEEEIPEVSEEELFEAGEELGSDPAELFSAGVEEELFSDEIETAELDELPVIEAARAARSTENDGFYRILHLDAGRKYFSVASIKAIIDNMASVGYNYLQLAVGNDGLRFLLDDMSVTANDVTYTSDEVKAAIHAGNEVYSNKNGVVASELTQAEMNEIISYANAKGISIIPVINTPGHMNAVVTAMEQLGVEGNSYNGSVSSIDITNAKAVNFTLALMQKYMDYFSARGSKLFNFGADEFANDIYTSGGMGFGHLVEQNKYDEFVKYINNLAAKVINAGMTPVAFNDGMYYGYNNADINKDIVVSYWSSGWNGSSGYNLASASHIVAQGHKMINTHGDWYYVLGKEDKWDKNGVSYANGFDINSFAGSTVSNPVGATFCIWCDYPSAETEQQVVDNTAEIIKAMGLVMGGEEVTDPTPNPEEVTLTDETTQVSVTAIGLTGFVAPVVTEVPEINMEEVSEYVAYDMKPETEEGLYINSAKVTVTLLESMLQYGADRLKGFAITDGTVEPIEGRLNEDGTYTFTMPHFSVGGVMALAENDIEDDNLVTGGTSYQLATNLTNGEAYLIASGNNGNVSVLTNNGGSATSTEATVSNGILTGNVTDNMLWTYNVQSSGYQTNYYLQNGLEYLYPSRTNNGTLWNPSYDYKLNIGGQNPVRINPSDNGFTIGRNTTGYIVYNNDNWKAASSGSALYFYTQTGSYTVNTSILSELIKQYEGEDLLEADYTADSWKKYVDALGAANTTLKNTNTSYSTEAAAREAEANVKKAYNELKAAHDSLVKGVQITISYVNENGETVYTETIRVAEGTGTYALKVNNIAGSDGKTYELVDRDNTDLKYDTSVVAYTVKVKEQEIDWSKVPPLTVEFWITNRVVTADGNTSIDIIASDVYKESGVEINTLVPGTGTQDGNDVVFWKSTRLASGNKQTDDSGVDKTKSGDDFAYLRYWENSWAYSADGVTWKNIESDDQIVAYYLQKTDVTQEITTNVVDWGQPYSEWEAGIDNRWFWDGYVESGTKFVFLDFAVVYEDGTQNPNAFPVDNTLFYHFDGNSASNPRVLGATTFTENEDYEIWKVTVQDGTCTEYQSASSFKPTYSDEETVVWTEDMGGEPHIDELKYYANRSGKLVLVYVRAKETEDSLTVHYVDRTNGDREFYNYNIAVKQGTVFDNGFALGTEKNTLINNTVVNIKDVTQTVNANLSTMSEIGEQYRFSDYTCVEVVRSVDGKEVYLYYNFNNTHSFVIDFGLPLIITRDDLEIDGDWNTSTVSNGTYGTADIVNGEIVYTPNKVLRGQDALTLTLTGKETDPITHQIYIIPATTVYYEESFVNSNSGFSPSGSSKGGNQSTDNSNYGFDAEYANDGTGASNGSGLVSTTLGSKAEFSFTGTGVDIYSNCTPNTGGMFIQVNRGSDMVKMIFVDTKMASGNTAATEGQDISGYNIPIASLDLGTYANYTLKFTHAKAGSDQANRTDGVRLDGFRVYNTLGNLANKNYVDAGESNPVFVELRNSVLKGLDVDTISDSKYAAQIAKDVLSQVYSTEDAANGAVVLDITGNPYTSDNAQDILDNGPKNELYLWPNQTVVFNLNATAQIGLKALNGAVNYSINGTGKELNTSTDMFYSDYTGTVTISNNRGGVLAITKIKAFGVPKAEVFAKITERDLVPALLSMGYEKEPAPVDADSITLNTDALNLPLGSTETLTATVAPENAIDKTVTWSVDNKKVATVDANGAVTAVGFGKATVTATTVNGITATCEVTVAPAAPKLNNKVTVDKNGKVTLTWDAVKDAKGYIIYQKSGNGWEKAGTANNKTTSCTVNGLKSGEYTFIVIAYAKVGSENYRSEHSNEVTVTVAAKGNGKK